MARGTALEQANAIILEDPVWSMAIGILGGLLGLLIVWFLIKVIEKSGFTWKAVGLDWRRNSLPLLLLGVLLALVLFFASILTGSILGSSGSSLNGLITGVSIPIFIQNFVLFLAMAFGEEIVFRGYVQTRLVERYGAIWGILITAVVFVLLHQISCSLSPVIILSGVMLWTTIGALYCFSRSLFLVVLFHGLMNTLLNTMHAEVGDISSMLVHALALLLVIVFALVRSRIVGIRSHPA
jgi:membrane protease YdiL (CAAX protease family)